MNLDELRALAKDAGADESTDWKGRVSYTLHESELVPFACAVIESHGAQHSRRPTRAAALYALSEWQQAIQHADELMAPAVSALLLPPESPPWVAVQQLQKSLTTVCAALVCDDAHNWLEWYWLENRMGVKATTAASNGHEPRPIQTLEDLAWLLGYPEDEPK